MPLTLPICYDRNANQFCDVPEGIAGVTVAAEARGRNALTPLFAATFLLSNVVSNVPAVMLLLPAATEPFSGPMLALVSTLAGNLLIVGLATA